MTLPGILEETVQLLQAVQTQMQESTLSHSEEDETEDSFVKTWS